MTPAAITQAGALGDPPTGAAIVFHDVDADAIEAFVQRDPYVQAGLVTSWRTSSGGSCSPPEGYPRIRPMAFPQTRLRRLRKTARCADSCARRDLVAADLVYPMFVAHGIDRREPIAAMPGVDQLSIDHAVEEAGEAAALGIPAVLLFGLPAAKDEEGSGAWDDEGVVQLATRAIKEAYPELLVITDVCLCEYTSHGHCGVLRDRRRGRQRRDARAARPRPPSRRPAPAPTSSRRAT